LSSCNVNKEVTRVTHCKERTHRRDVYVLHCSCMESSGVWKETTLWLLSKIRGSHGGECQ